MEIVELAPIYQSYVAQVIVNRWNETLEKAMETTLRWLHNVEDSICFVGVKDGIPIATGVFETHNSIDESIKSWNRLLWVEPEYRGSNLGSLLTEKRFEYAKSIGCSEIYIHTVSAKNYHMNSNVGWEVFKDVDGHTILKKILS
jgi:GNAT superfamily N-acetyltransferase